MLHIFKGLRRPGWLWEIEFKACWGSKGSTGLVSLTLFFLLMFDVQCCSQSGFLMLSSPPSPLCRLAPFSPKHVSSLALDPDTLGSYGFSSNWVVYIAHRLFLHSPFSFLQAPFLTQPFPSKPCLVFNCRSSLAPAITPLWLLLLRFPLAIFACANCDSSALQFYNHRDPPNSVLFDCSILQLNTFWQFYGIILFPRFLNYLGASTWVPVVSCSGVNARLTGSSVQQSRPS